VTRDRTTPAYADLSPIWRTCIDLAWESYRHGSLPIAAVVTAADGTILASGRNRLAERHDASPHLPGTPYLTGTPLAHAEVNALLELGPDRDPPHVVLYTTTEPCPLCMGAARMSSVKHVVYASRDPWAGCANMATGVPYLARRGPTVEGPVPELENALVAWQTSLHFDLYEGTPNFMASLLEVLPEACDAGFRLYEAGSLKRLADRGADADGAWEHLREMDG
jgi:tRNA(adenine34) deaminase